MTQDPVCDLQVDPDLAARSGLASQHEGVTYYFCGEHCKREFERYPAIYSDRAHERDDPETEQGAEAPN